MKQKYILIMSKVSHENEIQIKEIQIVVSFSYDSNQSCLSEYLLFDNDNRFSQEAHLSSESNDRTM